MWISTNHIAVSYGYTAKTKYLCAINKVRDQANK